MKVRIIKKCEVLGPLNEVKGITASKRSGYFDVDENITVDLSLNEAKRLLREGKAVPGGTIHGGSIKHDMERRILS